jgi:3-phenylpropionate/trans-cinnamate dioxygenase ferredoxin component
VEFVKVATVGEIGPGRAKRVEVGEDEIAVFNLDGEYYAIGDTCSHEEASLSEGDVFGECVECPLHGSEFDIRTGKALTLPAVLPVPTYPVKLEGDAILVGLGEE